MSLIVPIVIAAIVIGSRVRQMTPRLWSVVGLIVVSSVGWFYAHH